MILSDRTLRQQIAEGRIIIEPFDDSFVQPSSIDVRISNMFRVFRNYTAGVIDVKQDMADADGADRARYDGVFMLHPGEFVLGSTLERIGVPDDLVGRIEGKSSLGRLGLIIHSTAGLHRRRVRRAHHPGAHQHRDPADHAVSRHEDRPGQLHADDDARRQAVRQRRHGLEVPGPGGPDPQPLLRELQHVTAGGARRSPNPCESSVTK